MVRTTLHQRSYGNIFGKLLPENARKIFLHSNYPKFSVGRTLVKSVIICANDLQHERYGAVEGKLFHFILSLRSYWPIIYLLLANRCVNFIFYWVLRDWLPFSSFSPARSISSTPVFFLVRGWAFRFARLAGLVRRHEIILPSSKLQHQHGKNKKLYNKVLTYWHLIFCSCFPSGRNVSWWIHHPISRTTSIANCQEKKTKQKTKWNSTTISFPMFLCH